MKPSLVVSLAFWATASATLTAATPANLARWQSGATLLVKDTSNDKLNSVTALSSDLDSKREASLLSDDPSQGFRLERGATEIIIDLGMVRTISEFGFQSFSAGTQCQVSASVGRPGSSASWRGMGQVSVTPGSSAALSSPPIQARYVKLTFTTETPGQVSSLVLTGVEHAETSRVQRPSRVTEQDHPGQSGMLPVDLAQASQGAKVIGTSGIAEGQDMSALSDQNPMTMLALGGTAPAVFIFDLGADCDVDTLAFSHNGFKGQAEVFFLPTKVPEGIYLEQVGDKSNMTVSKGFFLGTKADATLVSTPGDFRSRKSFSSKPARFAIVRFSGLETGGVAPAIGGFSVIGHRSPDRVVPLLLAGQLGDVGGANSGGVVGGTSTSSPRLAPRTAAPIPVAARQADVPVNAADESSPE